MGDTTKNGGRQGRRPRNFDVPRNELAVLARRKSARITEFRRERPTDWRPSQVSNPDGLLDAYYTDESAWELIASKIEEGQPIEMVELSRPPGRTGYVMLIELGSDAPAPVYVKLELGSGRIYGRSFHYSLSS